jgi:MFS superfamily sulfate permease-like transporter
VSRHHSSQSQVSGLVVAVLTVVTLLFLTGLFESLPEATLAAVAIAAVIELVDVPALVRLYRIWTSRLGEIYGRAARPDFIAALAALLGVLVFDTLPGLFIGISMSLLLLLYRASRPNVAVLGRTPDGRGVDVAREDDAEAHRGRRQPSPLIPSPISLAPMTRQRTAMIAVLLAPIQVFSSSSGFVARLPSAK